jgi:hypothetical protein
MPDDENREAFRLSSSAQARSGQLARVAVAFALHVVILTVAALAVDVTPVPKGGLGGLITVVFVVGCIWMAVALIRMRHGRIISLLLPFSDRNRSEYADLVRLREVLDADLAYSEREFKLANRLRVIDALDGRIHIIRRRSTVMLASIAALLIAATLIIVFAGRLTNLDVSAVSNIERLTKEENEASTRLARLAELMALKERWAGVKHGVTTSLSERDRELKELESKISRVAREDETLPSEVGAMLATKQEAEKKLIRLRDLLQTAWNKELASERGYNDTRYIIATAITRVGVVLIIVFLVQILIGLYRYNVRLVTFYTSRRDLLQIWDGNVSGIEKLQRLMAANVEFGKEPKHPFEDILREGVTKLRVPGLSSTRVVKTTQ